MRRLPATAVTTALILLLGAGCSTAADEPAGATAPVPLPAPAAPGGATSAAPATSTGAADADAALAGNTQAVCDQAKRAGTSFGQTFAQDLKLLIDASSADDKAAIESAKSKSARDVNSYSGALADMSKLVDDPAVKKALADMSKQVTALKGDVRKLDGEKLAALGAALDAACRRS